MGLQEAARMAGLGVGDVWRFAKNEQCVSGALALSAFDRLSKTLAEAKPFEYRLQGVSEEGRLFIDLDLKMALVLACQRCLAPLLWEATLHQRYLLLRPSDPFPEDELEQDDFDAVVVEEGFDLQALLEDEVLLTLPYSPRHAQCDWPALAVS
jgi:uncharacterized protein